MRRLVGLGMTALITGCLVVYQPHIDVSGIDSNGLYDLSASDIITTEKELPDFESDRQHIGSGVINKVMEIERSGGIVKYTADKSSEQMMGTMEGFMDAADAVLDDELYGVDDNMDIESEE